MPEPTRRVALVANADFYVGPALARQSRRPRPRPRPRRPARGPGRRARGRRRRPSRSVDGRRATWPDPSPRPSSSRRGLARFGRLDSAVAFSGQIVTGRFLKSTHRRPAQGGVAAASRRRTTSSRPWSPPMVEQGDGQMLLITSASAARPTPGAPLYSSARAAATMLARNVADEVARNGVQVNAVGTNFMDFPEFLARHRRRPIPRCGPRLEAAGAAAAARHHGRVRRVLHAVRRRHEPLHHRASSSPTPAAGPDHQVPEPRPRWSTLRHALRRTRGSTVTAPQPVAVSGRRRAYAVVSLLAAAVLVLVFLVFLLRNGGHLLVALLGLAIAGAGAWWLITQRNVKRAIGLVGVLVGAVVMTVFIGKAVSAVDKPILRLLAVVVLLAVAAGAARLSLAREAHEIERDHPHHGTVPKHPVLICNPWSGGGKVEKFGLVELADELGRRDGACSTTGSTSSSSPATRSPGAPTASAWPAATARRRSSRRSRSSTTCPFVCVTAGTRNHFALDLGLDRDDPRKSLYAFRDAVERRIDYATVNGRFFVNNVSLGVYATIVQQEGYRDAKVETTEPLLPEMLGQTDKPFDLAVHRAGRHRGRRCLPDPGLEQPLRARRLARRLRSGGASTPASSASSPSPRPRVPRPPSVVTLSAVGQRNRSPNWHEFTTESFEVRSRSGKAYAGVDGEALEMATPLRFEIHPGGLRLYVPEGNLAVAEQRRARDVSLSSVVAVARGVEPLDA